MKRPRVAIDVTPLLYTPYGIGRMTRRVVEGVLAAQRPFEVILYGRRLEGPQASELGLGATFRRLRLPRAAEPLIAGLGLFDLACRADLYHATDFYSPIRSADKAVCSIHDVIFLTNRETMVDHTRLAREVPAFARRSRGVITISEFSKREIAQTLRIPEEKIHVTHLAAEADVFNPGDGPDAARERVRVAHGIDKPFFLGVSCSMGRKNTPALLSAYESLTAQAPENDLVLAWQPPLPVREAVAAGPAARRIHFIGRQPDDRLADLYRAATALVFPSLHEGFGLPVLEAMACGTPVICSKTTSLPEVGGDAPVYIDPLDQDSLVRALEDLENRQVDIAELRARGLAQAARFSWERCIQQTLEVYRQCLEA